MVAAVVSDSVPRFFVCSAKRFCSSTRSVLLRYRLCSLPSFLILALVLVSVLQGINVHRSFPLSFLSGGSGTPASFSYGASHSVILLSLTRDKGGREGCRKEAGRGALKRLALLSGSVACRPRPYHHTDAPTPRTYCVSHTAPPCSARSLPAASSAQMQAEPLTRARAREQSASQPFTFSFRPADVRPPKTRAAKTTLVPDALFGLSKAAMEERIRATATTSSQSPVFQSALPTEFSTFFRRKYFDGVAPTEADIKDDAKERFYPEFYEMKTSDKIHEQAKELAADEQACEIFHHISEVAQANEHNETEIARSVCLLAKLVRIRLGNSAGKSGYGTFVFQGDRQISNTKSSTK
ncbi:hypothetical protein BCV69DRAFT_133477 [Microstroma glucosiphilum]|uniref:Uncharacterized protein n=1 Tax=Pseudomicrostroma glucosiphilum TaxID=1684307 RepID=A0A316UB92_9BASI|nr:hypothetical protein BCV69DRAFT_133477 [Pseudomicrostroma glucosiphilum]PWN22124.1 hypothetical protein BCV69DRAFT_133477 [Pseudomicrostroma glucosiphilum]